MIQIDFGDNAGHECSKTNVQSPTMPDSTSVHQTASRINSQNVRSDVPSSQPTVFQSMFKKQKEKLHSIVTMMSHSPVMKKQKPLENEAGSSDEEDCLPDDEHDITG